VTHTDWSSAATCTGRPPVLMVATTWLVRGSIRTTVSPFSRDQPPTQTLSHPTAMVSAALATGTVATTRLLAGSIRETVPPSWFTTHTAPWPTAAPVGCRPTGMVASDGSGPTAGGS
jgi:hypothetical protein